MSAAQQPDPLDRPPSSLGAMSTRLANVLDREPLRTVRDIIALTPQQFLRIPSAGKARLAELEDLLTQHGLALAEKPSRLKVDVLPFPSVHQRLTWIEQRLTELEGALHVGERADR